MEFFSKILLIFYIFGTALLTFVDGKYLVIGEHDNEKGNTQTRLNKEHIIRRRDVVTMEDNKRQPTVTVVSFTSLIDNYYTMIVIYCCSVTKNCRIFRLLHILC